jgi:hypothetical protein
MTISQTQIVDYLNKKVGYGVAKTDTSTAKSPSNEANASPLLSPGSTIWQQDTLISSVTTLPSSNTIVNGSTIVSVYRDSLSSAVQCVSLSESEANETWTTGLTNWIPTQYGAGYQLQAYAGPSGSSTPSKYINLPQAGSGNADSWFFDYQAGILNFADTNVPTAVSGNVVYVLGARYTGATGITNFVSNISFGNITVNGTANMSLAVVSNAVVTTANIGNLIIDNGMFWANGISAAYGNVQNAQYLAANIDPTIIGINSNLTTFETYANVSYVPMANIYGNSNVAAYLPYYGGNIALNYITVGNVTVSSNLYITGQSFSVPSSVGGTEPGGEPAGSLRFNTTSKVLEFFNGTSWVGVLNNITDQQITPDGVSSSFTLNQTTTAAGIIVSINGTLQTPGIAYSVTGTTITFTETPLASDYIDVRYVASAVSAVTNYDVVNSANVVVGTSNVIVDSFNTGTYRSAKYVVSSSNGTDASMAEVLVLQNNGVTAINPYANVNTGSNYLTFYANISGSSVNFIAQSTTSSNTLRIYATYFNV